MTQKPFSFIRTVSTDTNWANLVKFKSEDLKCHFKWKPECSGLLKMTEQYWMNLLQTKNLWMIFIFIRGRWNEKGKFTYSQVDRKHHQLVCCCVCLAIRRNKWNGITEPLPPFLPPSFPVSLTNEQSEDRASKCFTTWEIHLK